MTDRITEKMLQFQLKMARENTGLNLELSKWAGRYSLVEIDSEGGESELSRRNNKTETYEVLYSLNKVIERAGIQKNKEIEG